jgi:sterol desaturase/sphingolipid hydroxylase (fatty acid hydroxylase superfamily)
VELAAIVLTPVTFLVMFVLEQTQPGRGQPAVRRWAVRGTLWFAAVAAPYLAVTRFAATLDFSPLHAPAIFAPLAFVIADGIGWFVHHGLHRVRPLWRWAHQLHHSAERIDVPGALWLHPFEVVLQIATLALVVIGLGLAPAGAALAAYFTIAAQLFVHANVRTPPWIGWIIQRPEAHAVHHMRGLHAYNYGLLPIWDRAFGTFRNPSGFTTEPAGFWPGSSQHVLAMLAGRDVGEPSTARGDDR